MTAGAPPPDWYADPAGAPFWRYWDGGAWTEQLRPWFASVRDAVGQTLRLDQGGITADADDVKLGDAVVARLVWGGAMSRAGGDATVQTGEGVWRLDQQGFLHAKVVVLDAATGAQVAVFEWADALRRGTLALADGTSLRWAAERVARNRARVGIRSMSYVGNFWLYDPEGQPVIGADLAEGVITISPLAPSAALPQLSLLVALAGYFVLRWWDSQTASTRDD